VIIGILSFIYCYFHKKEKISNLFSLSGTQYLAAFIISGLTIVSSLVYLAMEKDNVLTSSFLWRGISAVAFVAVGYVLFEEEITTTQMLGIIAIIIGSLLVASDAGGD
jgi:multidrug transporter EmrE-like cation transporter